MGTAQHAVTPSGEQDSLQVARENSVAGPVFTHMEMAAGEVTPGCPASASAGHPLRPGGGNAAATYILP